VQKCIIKESEQMTRKKIPEAGPYRYIKKSDIGKSFRNELFTVNKVTLKTLYYDNKGNTHVLVYDFDKKILAFLAFQDMGTHFHLDLVEQNRIQEAKPIKPGTKLIDLMDDISRYYNYKKIDLLALPDMVNFYQSLGFHSTGKNWL